MKRSNKLILSLALGSTVVATFGTAFALYKSGFDDSTVINIGTVQTNTDTAGNINYLINTPTSTYYKWDSVAGTGEEVTDATALSPDVNRVMINAGLSFEYESGYQGAKQLTTIGRFTVTVALNENIPDGTNVYARLKGYDSVVTQGTSTYFTVNKQSDFLKEEAITQGSTTVSGYIDTAVEASGISCDITLDFSNSITDDKFFDIAELTNAYNVTLKWEPYNSNLPEFDSNLVPNVYIRGDKASWTENLEAYAMVPNIRSAAVQDNTKKVEWYYKGLTGFNLAKVYDGSLDNPWIDCRGTNATGASVTEDGNNNIKFTNIESDYEVYYVRGGTDTDIVGFWVSNNNN